MFGDEKTLSNVQHILAKQQEGCINAGDLGSGLDFSLKYMAQFVADTRDVLTGLSLDEMNYINYDDSTVDTSNTSYEENEENNDNDSAVQVSELEISFLELPIQVHLHILSFLNASDICKLSATCQQSHSICDDELLWRDVLNKEKAAWTELSNTSNPALYADVNSDLSNKEIYMRCNPKCARQQHFDILSIPRLLWSYLPQKSPKVAMFGPGLESNTSTIVRKLIGNECNTFQVQGVFPAEHPGVGTGFNISMNNKAQLRLITLYSGTKRERTNTNMLNATRADRNKLLRPVTSATSDEDGGEDEMEMKYEPTPAVRDLCRTTDAFIFVVDASVSLETLPESRPELFALMNERWTPSKAPLLVLSCTPDTESDRIPCVDMAQQFNMHRINRSWKMFDATVSSLSGVVEGITWLLEATHRR